MERQFDGKFLKKAGSKWRGNGAIVFSGKFFPSKLSIYTRNFRRNPLSLNGVSLEKFAISLFGRLFS